MGKTFVNIGDGTYIDVGEIIGWSPAEEDDAPWWKSQVILAGQTIQSKLTPQTIKKRILACAEWSTANAAQ